jgi:hypothetical protein
LVARDQRPTVNAEEAFWAQALDEIEKDKKRPGLWAKAFSLSDGEDQKACATYLQLRVDQLLAERTLELAEQHRLAEEKLVAERSAEIAEQRRREEEETLERKRLEKIEAEYTEVSRGLRNLAYQLKAVGFGQNEVKEQLLGRGLAAGAATQLVSELFGKDL